MSESNKVYTLKKHEFLILVAIAGMKKIYGFDLEGTSLEKEESLYILQDLVQKNYVRVEGERFLPVNDMEIILKQLCNVRTILDVHKASGRCCILYLSDMAVKITQSLRRKDMLEIMLMAKEQVWEHLQDEGWIEDDTQTMGEIL